MTRHVNEVVIVSGTLRTQRWFCVEGDWRLPTKSELVGITVGDEYIRSSQMYFFTNVQSDYYWSSTTVAINPTCAWSVYMDYNRLGNDDKYYYDYVWPVRGGQ